MNIKIGDIVISSEVPLNNYGRISQEKHLEVIEFLDNEKVKCRDVLVNQKNNEDEFYKVTLHSLRLINRG